MNEKEILILGGTNFIGPHLVRSAQARGHRVTLFNRGKTNPELFDGPAGPSVEQLHGDRLASELDAVRGRRFDAVIDTCGYVPGVVREVCEALEEGEGGFDHYTFVSSISVYADHATPGITEDHPLATLDGADSEELTPQTYGALKARCEEAAAQACGERLLTIRPGYIVGPRDPTDRFTYWPARAAMAQRCGGVMAVPGAPDDPLQYIDARDLADWTIACVDAGATGTFNAVSPAGERTFGGLLEASVEAARAQVGAAATPRWIPADAVARAEARFPIWACSGGVAGGVHLVDGTRAQAAGLACRPERETVEATLAWFLEQGRPLREGPSEADEAALLASD